MSQVDIYTKKSWTPDKASYKLGSGVIATVAGAIALFFTAILGTVGTPPNYGLALSALIIVVMGLFSAFTRPKLDDLYRIAPRPPLQNRPVLLAIGGALGFFIIGQAQRVFIKQEVTNSFLASLPTPAQVAILGGSGISENLFIDYLLFSVMFGALLLSLGNYAIAMIISQITAGITAWIFHYGVYGLDPSYFGFVFTSFLTMGILYWLFGSVMLVILIHVWWNVGAIVWAYLGLPTIYIPGIMAIGFFLTKIPFGILMVRMRSGFKGSTSPKARRRGLALFLVALAVLATLFGTGLVRLSPIQPSPTNPVLFDQSSQFSQAQVVSCNPLNAFGISISSCNSQGPFQATVNPSATNLASSLPIAFVWANGFQAGDGIVNRNVAGVLATLGSVQPGSTLSVIPLSAGCVTGLMTSTPMPIPQSCLNGPGCTSGPNPQCGCQVYNSCPSSGTSGTPSSSTGPSCGSNGCCSAPPTGFSGTLFCPPNSLPTSNYQLTANLNGAVKRLDLSNFASLYGETSGVPYIANFYYTTNNANFTTTQAWLVQRYGMDIRLQIQGDTLAIGAKCLNQGTILFVNQNCSQMIGSALAGPLNTINSFDKASGYVDVDVSYPGIASQPGEIDGFLGAWMAGSSCQLSASSVANAPVINGAVSPPGGASVSVPLCVPHNSVPFAPGSCSTVAGSLDFTKYTNASTAGTPLSNLCSTVKLRISVTSFGPTYKVKVFNANGGDQQSQTCYQIISANDISGTKQGCDWGISYDQGMILDVPVYFDYMSYFTTRAALKIACGSPASCGPSICPTGYGLDSTGKICTGPGGYQTCASGYNGIPPACTPNGGNGGGLCNTPSSCANNTKTGSTLVVTVVDSFGIPLSGETITLTTGSGTSNGPNPCTTGLNGQCPVPFNILAGSWTVSSAENGYALPILFTTIPIPPVHNPASVQTNVQAGSNSLTLTMATNGQFFFAILGITVGLAFVIVLVYVAIRAIRGGASRTPQAQTFGYVRKGAQVARKAYSQRRSKK